MLTIVASMERELSGLRRENVSGQHGHSMDLRVVGVGKSRSQASLRKILRSSPSGSPSGILVLGFAGAVDRELKTGDLILSGRYYLDCQGNDFVAPDSAMRQNAIIAATNAGLPVSHLDSLTVDRIISNQEAKAALAVGYPVGIVGMEDFWLASAALDAGVPFLSARVVLDTAQQSLPGHLLGLSQGRALDVLKTAATPWRAQALFRLAYQARIAQRILTKFAVSFIRQWGLEGRTSTDGNVAGALAGLDR